MSRHRMKAAGVILVAALTASTLTSATTASADDGVPRVHGAGAASAVKDSYLVRLKDTPAVREAGVEGRARALAREYGGTLGPVFVHALKGFAVTMPAERASQLSTHPDVERVEQDQRRTSSSFAEARKGSQKPAQDGQPVAPSAVQTPVSWGLDRVDQHALPLDNHYAYDDAAGRGVTIYQIISGVETSHPEFGGRAVAGPNFVADGGGSGSGACNPWSTRVAGVAAGSTHGVAKAANLVAVRVFGCDDISRGPSIEQGFEWVIRNAVRPAVILFTLADVCALEGGGTGPCPPELAQSWIAIQEAAFAAGIAVVTTAGDNANDACGRSSGAAPDSLHVGATAINDARAGFSNFGPCVTMYAPGENISTANAPSGSTTASGTGIAAAHAAGTVALFMSKPEFAGASPGRVRDELIQNRSTPNVITGLPGGSFNRLLYTGPPGFFTVGEPAAMAPTGATGDKLQLFGTDSAGALYHRQQTQSGGTGWTNWTQSINKGWQSVGAGANADGRIALAAVTVTGGEAWIRQETTANSNKWSNWTRLGVPPNNGTVGRIVMAHNNSNRLQVFITTTTGKVYYRSQLGAGSSIFGAWTQLNAPVNLRSLTSITNADGRIEVLGVDDAGAVWRTAQTTATDTNWGQFTKLPGFGVTAISAARNANGTLELVGLDTGGGGWRRAQTTAGGTSWTNWTPLSPKVLAHVTARTTSTARVQLVGVDNLGGVWQSVQNSANGTAYSGWSRVDGTLRP